MVVVNYGRGVPDLREIFVEIGLFLFAEKCYLSRILLAKFYLHYCEIHELWKMLFFNES